MTELLRAIMDGHPHQPDEYYQTIFEKNFELTSVQVQNRNKIRLEKSKFIMLEVEIEILT